MNNKSARLKLPSFHVELDNAQVLTDSLERIKQGAEQYSYEDLCIFSDWIGICAFQFMADKFQEKKQRNLLPEDVQNYRLYLGKCGDVARITNNFLKKAAINFTWCGTKDICQGLQEHYLILADVPMKEGHGSIIYDHSLRQFADTTEKGYLKKDNGWWSMRTSKYTIQNLSAEKDGMNLIEEIVKTGSAMVSQKTTVAYIDAFTSSIENAYPSFQKKDLSDLEKFKQFNLDKNYIPSENNPYKRYTSIPGEPEFERLFKEFTTFQYQLNK